MLKIDSKTKALLSDPKKRRAWIHYQLMLRGKSAAAIAESSNVTRQCLYQAFRAPYPKMERIIAKAIGLSAATLFPERYDEFGLPLRRYGKKAVNANGRTRCVDCNVKIRKAA